MDMRHVHGFVHATGAEILIVRLIERRWSATIVLLVIGKNNA